MIDLKPYQDHINNLCKLLRVQELELFGSATRDDFSPDSDIDVLVTFEGREQLFARYFDLKEGLEQIFGRRVDVVMPEAITKPIFREHIEKERTVVYGPSSHTPMYDSPMWPSWRRRVTSASDILRSSR